MEKLNDVLKPLIGMLLLVTFIVAFSSCEQQTSREVRDRDTAQLAQESQADEDAKRKIEEEAEELQVRFDSLKIKARHKSKQAEREVGQVIDKLNKERKDLTDNNTEAKLEDKWEELKQRSKAVIDSLDKKL